MQTYRIIRRQCDRVAVRCDARSRRNKRRVKNRDSHEVLYVRSFCVATDAGDIKMFFSLTLIFMCCVNTDERLFLFTREKKNETVFYIHNELVRC